MKKKITQIIRHPLISGSVVVVIGSMLGNVFNYLYNLSMGRLLDVSGYGVLISLISLFNILAVFPTAITLVFSKFAASFIAQNNKDAINVLLRKGTILIGGVGLLVALFLVFFAIQISSFLHIKEVLLIDFIALALFFLFISSLIDGVLQGLLKFFTFSAVYGLATLIKFVIGVILVLLGFNIFGAVGAILISGGLGFIFRAIAVKDYWKKDRVKNPNIPNLHRELSNYAIPVFLSGIGLTMLDSMHVILVKHFFSPIIAGQYAALSLMGRTIFFVVSPITLVFFPLIAQKKERNENLRKTVILAATIIGFPVVLLSGIYFLVPKFIISIFFPAKIYAGLTSYMGLFSIFVVFYTFCYFLNSYFLSIGKIRVFLFGLSATILEALFIIVFHKDIYQIIFGLIIVSVLFFISLLMYYLVPVSKKEHLLALDNKNENFNI